MLYYVAHKYGGQEKNFVRARKVTRRLQLADPQNCYICPLLVFSHLDYGSLGKTQEVDLCIDLLSVCDKLIVASEISEGMAKELDFARLVGMEVEFLK